MNNQDNNYGDLIYWVITVILLLACWPIGLILLIRKLMGYGKSNRRTSRHPYDIQREQRTGGAYQSGSQTGSTYTAGKTASASGSARRPSPPPTKGKGLTIFGAILTAIGALSTLGAFMGEIYWGLLSALRESIFPLGITAAGLVLLYAGVQRTRKGKRFRRYQALIGKRESISIHSLAEALSLPYQTVCEELQEMLDDGVLPVGYVDIMSGRLVLSDEGLEDREEPAQEEPVQPDRADAILKEIRQLNDDIDDVELSAKIDRIEDITGKIFAYLKSNPGKESQLRSFLNYYLPTTLKILHAYAQLEDQGIEGENISTAKERIETMMDKVVEGVEKQLDKLFQDSTLDITTDVQVLERMLSKDGLSDSGSDGISLEL